MRKRIGKHRRRTWPLHFLLMTLCFIVVSPILFALIKATQPDAVVMSGSLVPGGRLVENLRDAWRDYDLERYMRNSLVLSITVTLGKTALSLLAAMALVYFDFKGRKILFFFILATLFMPTESLIVGLFDVISLQPAENLGAFLKWFINPVNVLFRPAVYGFGWVNRFPSIVVPFLASATGVFLFRQHFLTIPHSMGDAARIDGVRPMGFLFRVLIPLSGSTIGALWVIQFVFAWNQYVWPRVIIRSEQAQVIQVGLKAMVDASEGTQWGQVMAGTIISLIPPLLVFILLLERLMRGVALGGGK